MDLNNMKRWLLLPLSLILLGGCTPSSGTSTGSSATTVQTTATVVTAPPTAAPTLPMAVRELSDDCSEPRVEGDVITHVVIHFMSNVVARPDEPFDMDDIQAVFEQGGVSSHYVIARDGAVVQFVAEDRVAYHAGKGTLAGLPAYENRLNWHSIGIELLGVGSQAEMAEYLTSAEYARLSPDVIGFTDAQYVTLRALLAKVAARHDVVLDRQHVIGHDEYAPSKRDPGGLFDWGKVGF